MTRYNYIYYLKEGDYVKNRKFKQENQQKDLLGGRQFGKRKVNVDGKFACMANWVILRKEGEEIVAHNCLTSEDYIITLKQAEYLVNLNGNRNPLLDNEGCYSEEYLNFYMQLHSMFLLRNSRRSFKLGRLTKVYTVYIPEERRMESYVYKILNFLLFCLCIPVFVFGIYRLFNYGGYIGRERLLIGYFCGLILALIIHESGHIIACRSYGGYLMEVGILQKFTFLGKYVLIDDSELEILKKIQIRLAGVEMNLLFSGVMFIIISYVGYYGPLYTWTGAMLCSALVNLVFAGTNSMIIGNLDGEQVINILLGLDSKEYNAKANTWAFFIVFFSTIGINGKLSLDIAKSLFTGQYILLRYIYMCLLFFILLSVEEIIIGIIVRLIVERTKENFEKEDKL